MSNHIVSVCGTLRARSHLSSYPLGKKEVCLQETAKVLEVSLLLLKNEEAEVPVCGLSESGVQEVSGR